MDDERIQISMKALDKETIFAEILLHASKIKRRQSSEFLPPEEIIRQMREERDEQLRDKL